MNKINILLYYLIELAFKKYNPLTYKYLII